MSLTDTFMRPVSYGVQPINLGFTDLSSMANQASNNMGGALMSTTPKLGNTFSTGAATTNPNMFSKQAMFGEGGWVMPAAQVGAGLLQGFMGMKQMKLAKDMFRQQSEYAATDLANQAKTVNERLATRQARRVQENPNATPVNEFMSKYAVSGKVGG